MSYPPCGQRSRQNKREPKSKPGKRQPPDIQEFYKAADRLAEELVSRLNTELEQDISRINLLSVSITCPLVTHKVMKKEEEARQALIDALKKHGIHIDNNDDAGLALRAMPMDKSGWATYDGATIVLVVPVPLRNSNRR